MTMFRKSLLAATSALCLLHSPVLASPAAMTAEDARHLISRTGFGASPDEIAALVGMSYADAVTRLVDGIGTTSHTPMPTWIDDWAYPYEQIWTLDQTTTELFYTNRWVEIEQLAAWWLAEMAATPSPMTERLVLFWSDHFANSFGDHENSQWTGKQNRFFRENAAGNFADLAHGMLHDPAMLVFLDNVSNNKDAPNENLGREFLELFTLGEGRGYTQDDVRAAARMLTGTTVSEDGTPTVIFDEEMFDPGNKTIFGQTGRYDANDLVDLTLSHQEFGPYIVEKLWLNFISDQPDTAEVARLAQLWRDNDLELKPLLQELFLTDAFWDKANRGRLVKSPIELLIGTARTLGQTHDDIRDLIWVAEELGQHPFQPPNVGGWPESIEWINDASAAGRATALTAMLTENHPVETAEIPPMMVLNSGEGENIVTAKPNDLRIGQVFATYIEMGDPGGEYGGLYTLYDVGFKGYDWRSITFWIQHNPDEIETGLYLHIGDCAPNCFANLPADDDPTWVAFEPWPGFADEHPDLSGHDHDLMRALATHLPSLIASTDGQIAYGIDEDDPGAPVIEVAPMIKAADVFADTVGTAMGQHDGDLVWGFSRPNVLGLAGLAEVQDDGVDEYLEASEEARSIPLIPATTYATTRDWMNALPGTGPQSARAAKALLAVLRASGGLRDELIVQDPDAFLRRVILSPAYQVK